MCIDSSFDPFFGKYRRLADDYQIFARLAKICPEWPFSEDTSPAEFPYNLLKQIPVFYWDDDGNCLLLAFAF